MWASTTRRVGSLLLSSWPGLAVLIAVWLPLTAWRAHLETNFWIDETYSVMLTTYPVDQLVRLTAADAHPPGYYLALKAWLKAARVMGFEPGIFWARSLNLVLWLLLAAGAWFGGRDLLGPRDGTILAWAVVGSAYPALVARDLRSYAVGTVALFGCFLVLLLLVRRSDGDESSSRGRIATLWVLYALAAGVALWTHLLSALVLPILLLLWIVLLVRRRHLSPAFVCGAVAANLAAALAFLPWLAVVGRQLGFLARSAPDWMTPPTWGNLFRVFTFWYPLGRIGDPSASDNRFLVPLGILAAGVPLAAALATGWRGTRSRTFSFPARAGALATGVAVAFVFLLWLLHRLGVTYTFHGPRYPSLTANLWTAGLACFAVWSVSLLRWRPAWAAVFMVPWLLCSVLGQSLLARREAQWGLAPWQVNLSEYFPAAGEPLYVMPSELMAFYRRTLRDFEMRRMESFPCEALHAENATVLNVNFWPGLDRARDHLARHFIATSSVAAQVHRLGFPERQKDYTIYRLEGIRPDRLAPVCITGFSSQAERELAGAASRALPEAQIDAAHWSFLELGPDFTTSRWATTPRTPVIFDRPLPEGEFLLHFSGYRSPYPRDPLTIQLALADHEVRWAPSLGSGRFHLRLPVRLESAWRRPVLLVEHDLWSPARSGLSNDERELSFLLYAAWFEEI